MELPDDGLPDEEFNEDFDKAMGQFRLLVGAVLSPLMKYGQADYVAMVIPEIASLAYQLHLKLWGIDEPYNLDAHVKHMIS